MKRILHVYNNARRAKIEFKRLYSELIKVDKNAVVNHNSRTIKLLEDEHVFYTEYQVHAGHLDGLNINECRGDIPPYLEQYLNYLVRRSNGE